LRKKATYQHNPRTAEQQCQRNKFKVVNGFLSGLGEYFRHSFAEVQAQHNNTYSAAVKYNINNAVAGEGVEHYIDMDAVRLGDGMLTPASNVRWHRDGNYIVVEWTDNSGIGSAREDDIALPLYLVKEKHFWFYTLDGAKRGDCCARVYVDELYKTEDLEVWLTFKRADASISSESVHGVYDDGSRD